jgi:hypothetical protein
VAFRRAIRARATCVVVRQDEAFYDDLEFNADPA